MSTDFSQQLLIIGRPGTKDLSKVLNLPVEPWTLSSVNLSGCATNRPAFPAEAMSKGHPNLIFAISTMVECQSYYRSIFINGDHLEVLSLPFADQATLESIEPHSEWARSLEYEDVLKEIQATKALAGRPVSRIPITEETEVLLAEPQITVKEVHCACGALSCYICHP
jgi:hypothetical protein